LKKEPTPSSCNNPRAKAKTIDPQLQRKKKKRRTKSPKIKANSRLIGKPP